MRSLEREEREALPISGMALVRAEAAEHEARLLAVQALPHCSLELERIADAIHITSLSVPRSGGRRGQGLATDLMAAVLDVADRHGVPVTLDADPTLEAGDPDLVTLMRRYQAFGFVATGVNEMDWVRMERPAQPHRGVWALIEAYFTARADDCPVDDIRREVEELQSARDQQIAASPGYR